MILAKESDCNDFGKAVSDQLRGRQVRLGRSFLGIFSTLFGVTKLRSWWSFQHQTCPCSPPDCGENQLSKGSAVLPSTYWVSVFIAIQDVSVFCAQQWMYIRYVTGSPTTNEIFFSMEHWVVWIRNFFKRQFSPYGDLPLRSQGGRKKEKNGDKGDNGFTSEYNFSLSVKYNDLLF